MSCGSFSSEVVRRDAGQRRELVSRGRFQTPCNGSKGRVQLGIHSLSVAASPPNGGAVFSRGINKGERGGAKSGEISSPVVTTQSAKEAYSSSCFASNILKVMTEGE